MYKYKTKKINGICARVVLDSYYKTGMKPRLTTLELEFPRFILAEFNTHRCFSRNSSSSRATPFYRQELNVVPLEFGENRPGMSADKEIRELEQAKKYWIEASKQAYNYANKLKDLGVHKQITNRVIEPFITTRTLVTATEWNNFLTLRCHKTAQPEMRKLALCIRECLTNNQPDFNDSWHLPYVRMLDYRDIETAKKCSAARCARVSYFKHDKTNPSIVEDLNLFKKLCVRAAGDDEPIHLSPLEHQAKPRECDKKYANFTGWQQFRSEYE